MSEFIGVENLEFKWGKKRGRGGKNMGVQFYESFTFDGTEYNLYDNVYLSKEGETFPYLGKLIKIWENPDKAKKVKILWYFHPSEISNFLLEELTCQKEVFLACGEGVGLANVNPLEAIVGKCNVVCISKDSRNPQPSDEQVQMAEHVFSRFFDVGQCIILDKIDEKIAGIDVNFFFNQEGSLKPPSVNNLIVDERMSSPKPESSGKQIPEDDKLKEQKSVVGKNLDANGKMENAAICETASSVKVREDSDLKEFSVKPNLSHKGKLVCGVVIESDKLDKTNVRQENTSDVKIVGSSSVNQVQVDEKLKSIKSGEIHERPHKKAKLDSSVKVSNDNNRNNIGKLNNNSDGNNSKLLVPNNGVSEDKTRPATDPLGKAKKSSRKLKVDKKMKKPVNGKLPRESPKLPLRDCIKSEDKPSEVTNRPDSDRSKWFAELPWEERMQEAHERGKLVLFQNLDPAYSSAEVEEIVCEVFKETCKVKLLQKMAYSSPHSGQALGIFKTSEVAEWVVRELDEGCLLLPNGRPLIASIANPFFPKNQSTFAGHLVIDKLKTNRELKDALSTSHSAQPNTLEYEMAMEWCLLLEKSDRIWRRLYKRHGEELEKLKANLKSK